MENRGCEMNLWFARRTREVHLLPSLGNTTAARATIDTYIFYQGYQHNQSYYFYLEICCKVTCNPPSHLESGRRVTHATVA